MSARVNTPFTPRPSPLSGRVSDKCLDNAVRGLKKDYPKLATLAIRLNALGQQHARAREEIMEEEVGILTKRSS